MNYILYINRSHIFIIFIEYDEKMGMNMMKSGDEYDENLGMNMMKI